VSATRPGKLIDRLVGAPISSGVCEVLGWGPRLDPDTVLTEMAALGLVLREVAVSFESR
jgi:hypothetical protein